MCVCVCLCVCVCVCVCVMCKAGVVEEMDELASDFMANSDERGDILAKAVEEAESHEDPQ